MTWAGRPESLPPADAKLVVVDASAGTGKTFFLEHRVADLVIAGAELPQILLVTFTEKAVAELRTRIRDLLDRLSRTIDLPSASPSGDAARSGDSGPCVGEAQTRLRAAVAAFDRAPIHTIHGFCHRILVEDAFAARRLFDQTQVADEVAFDAAFTALLRERFASVEPDRSLLAAYLAKDKQTVDRLRDLLLGCARTGAPAYRRFDPAPIPAIAAPLIEAFGTKQARAALHAQVPWHAAGKTYGATWIDAVGDAFAGLDAHATHPARLLAAFDAFRDRIDKLVKQLERAPALMPLVGALNRVLATMTIDEAIAAELLPAVMERVGADKAENGLFDYDDMLALVADALAGPRGADLAARLRARTPWVMIDEFQDTDPRQWQIFRTVWMHPDSRGLAIVGDPKQAIYGFRGADVATYVAARDEMKRAGAVEVELNVNRRTTPQLLDAVHHVLIGNPVLPMMQGTIQYERPVVASGDVTSTDIVPPLTVFALQGSGKVDPQRLALATAIGDQILALRERPPMWTGRGSGEFSLSQVMVLTQRNRESVEISAALRRRGLPCALVESDKLFETREAAELAAVLAAVAAPRDRSARLRALRTRFFHVPWTELARVVDAPDHHPAIARLFDWAALAARRAYEPLFRKIVEDSRFAERALVVGGGERAVTNTWHLLELLLLEVARSRGDLSELVDQLRRWIADGSDRQDDLDVQRAETDAEAVRVLTIHKAKGLEAPYVFVYGCTGSPPSSRVNTMRDATGRVLVVDPQDPATKERIAHEAAGEAERLAYVALTRAQVRLYLPYYAEAAKIERAMYRPVQMCLASVVLGKAQQPGFRVVPVTIGADEAPPAAPDALAAFEAPMPPVVAEPPVIDGARAGLLALSYTRLAHDLDRATAKPRRGEGGVGPELAIDPSEIRADDDTTGLVGPNDLPPGTASGLMLHEALELADLSMARDARDFAAWAAEPSVDELLKTAARTHGVEPRFLPHAKEIVHRMLTAPLVLAGGGEALPAMVEASPLAREVEFSFPLPGEAGFVKGYIDALVCYGDELWVLDYKSDLLGGTDVAASAADRVREKYAVQARLYALAAAKMQGKRRFAGLLFTFLRYHVTVPIRVDAEHLEEWAAWLATLASGSRGRAA